jgi:SH3-like domain-containing protein
MHVDFRCRIWNVLRLLAPFLLLAFSLSADTRVTLSRVRLHVAPVTDSQVVATVPAAVQLSVDFCSRNWCTTSWNGANAWVKANAGVQARVPETSR